MPLAVCRGSLTVGRVPRELDRVLLGRPDPVEGRGTLDVVPEDGEAVLQ